MGARVLLNRNVGVTDVLSTFGRIEIYQNSDIKQVYIKFDDKTIGANSVAKTGGVFRNKQDVCQGSNYHTNFNKKLLIRRINCFLCLLALSLIISAKCCPYFTRFWFFTRAVAFHKC